MREGMGSRPPHPGLSLSRPGKSGTWNFQLHSRYQILKELETNAHNQGQRTRMEMKGGWHWRLEAWRKDIRDHFHVSDDHLRPEDPLIPGADPRTSA